MTTTTIQRWQLEYDAEATRQAFAQLPFGSGCDCQECRNFFAAIDRAFPAEFIRITEQLGIDVTKPTELAHYGGEPTSLLIVGGWFHFVGRIIAGEDAMREDSQGTGHFYLEHLTPDFSLGFSSHLALVAEAFRPQAVVQLEFETRVPWVLAEVYAPDERTYEIKT
jgi:hypothetical protein